MERRVIGLSFSIREFRVIISGVYLSLLRKQLRALKAYRVLKTLFENSKRLMRTPSSSTTTCNPSVSTQYPFLLQGCFV